MKKLLSLLVGVMLVSSFGVCLADDEIIINDPVIIPIEEPYIIDAPLFRLVAGTITLAEGWNLVAMPVLPSEPYTIEHFIKAVERPWRPIIGPILHEKLNEGEVVSKDEKGMDIIILPRSYWKIPLVAVYKNGQFERYPKEGVTYNMVPGEAYFVYARYSGKRAMIQYSILEGTEMPPIEQWRPTVTVKITGKPLNVPVSLNLNRGWSGAAVAPIDIFPNLNDISEKPLNLFSTGDLSRELEEQQVKATRVAFWRADRQEWEQYALPLPVYAQPDPGEYHTMNSSVELQFIRFIRPDEGFFLLCEENGLYIPGLNTNTVPKPPVPPFPPKPPVIDERVSYTGKIEHIASIPEGPYPPSGLALIEGGNPNWIYLRGINDVINEQLNSAANEGAEYTVEGVMETITYETGQIAYNFNGGEYHVTTTADVLLVDTVIRLGFLQ